MPRNHKAKVEYICEGKMRVLFKTLPITLLTFANADHKTLRFDGKFCVLAELLLIMVSLNYSNLATLFKILQCLARMYSWFFA